MPCHDPDYYGEPYILSGHLQEAELEIRRLREKNDILTETLCSVLKFIEGNSPEIKARLPRTALMWWTEHQILDAERSRIETSKKEGAGAQWGAVRGKWIHGSLLQNVA